MTAADGVRFARQGYEGAATAWAAGAELVYGPLADALLARAPHVAGQLTHRRYYDGEARQQFSIAFRAPLTGGQKQASDESSEVEWLTPARHGDHDVADLLPGLRVMKFGPSGVRIGHAYPRLGAAATYGMQRTGHSGEEAVADRCPVPGGHVHTTVRQLSSS